MISGVITIFIIVMLIMSGFVDALKFELSEFSNDNPVKGEIISFKSELKIFSGEELKGNIKLNIDGVNKSSCDFSIDGKIIGTCSGVSIQKLSEKDVFIDVPDNGYGYGYGYNGGGNDFSYTAHEFNISFNTSSFNLGDFETWLEASNLFVKTESEKKTFTIHPFNETVIYKLNVLSPSAEVFSQRRIPIHLTSNQEIDSIKYIDKAEKKTRERDLCRRNCKSFNRIIGFREGFHNVTFIAIKNQKIVAEASTSFFIDSRIPEIKQTSPRVGFTAGNFSVSFIEQNPSSLVLWYGNSLKSKKIDLTKACSNRKDMYDCSTFVNLSNFDNQKISYRFILTDVAGNKAISRLNDVLVNSMPPIINSVNFTINRNLLNFAISVSEKHFNKITYIDRFDSKVRERLLCSQLEKGVCRVRKSFNEGTHNLRIIASDEAGNEGIKEGIVFTIS